MIKVYQIVNTENEVKEEFQNRIEAEQKVNVLNKHSGKIEYRLRIMNNKFESEG